MSDNIVNTRIKLAIKSASDWSTANPVLLQGEVGLDSTNKVIKVGDGVTAWNSLDEWNPALPTNHVTTDTTQDITGEKTFVGQKRIKFKQSSSSDKLGFTLYTSGSVEQGYLEYNPTNLIDGYPLMTIGNYASSASGITQVGFRRYSSVSGASGAYNLLMPLISDAKTPFDLTTTYTNFYLPLGFKNGNTMVTTAKSGVVDLGSLIPTPTAQVQADWTQSDNTQVDYIKNKPTLATVATSGSYADLSNTPTIPATNVIPATSTGDKFLMSTTTSGTAKWSDFSSAGFLKTNSSGVISVDTVGYLPLSGGTMTGAIKYDNVEDDVETKNTIQDGNILLEYENNDSSPTLPYSKSASVEIMSNHENSQQPRIEMSNEYKLASGDTRSESNYRNALGEVGSYVQKDSDNNYVSRGMHNLAGSGLQLEMENYSTNQTFRNNLSAGGMSLRKNGVDVANFNTNEIELRGRIFGTCNKIDMASLEQGDWDYSNPTIRVRGQASVNASTTYTLSVSGCVIAGVVYLNSSGTMISFENSGNATFTFTTPSGCVTLVPVFKKSDDSAISVSNVSNLQLEKGSSASSYVPYAMDNVELTNRKYVQDWESKNLLDQALIEQGDIDASTGADTSMNSTLRLRSPFSSKLSPSTTYTISHSPSSVYVVRIFFYTITKAFISATYLDTPWTYSFTTPSNCYYVRFNFRKSDGSTIVPSDLTSLQLEKGSSASSYVPYAMDNVELTERVRRKTGTLTANVGSFDEAYCRQSGDTVDIHGWLVGLSTSDSSHANAITVSGVSLPSVPIRFVLTCWLNNGIASYAGYGVLDTYGNITFVKSVANANKVSFTITYVV